FVGIISAAIQGGLIGKLVEKFGEPLLVIVGAFLFSISLVVIPFVTPATGLVAILTIGAVTSIGQAFMAPSLTSLGSKSAGAAEQGSVLGVMQSVASLARAVGPSLAAILIYSSVAHTGFGAYPPLKMSDASIVRTFWTAAAIQIVALVVAIYFARVYGRSYSKKKIAAGA